MKKLILVSAIALVLSANAQQRPHYTQYVLNNYIINPAVAGIENYTDVKISHRAQWVGLDGAPVTTYFTIHAPTKKRDYERENATTVRAAGENPRGKAYWLDYTKAEPHGGIGATILNDRTGPLNRFSASLTYAYHLGITERTSLSMGISAGVQNMTLNTGKLQFEVPVDPAVAGSGYLNKVSPDVSLGLWMYNDKYFLGLAAQNVFPSKLKFTEDTVRLDGGKLVPHLFLTGGYRMFLSDDVSFMPSVMIKYISPSPIGIDFNAKFLYRDILWAGAGYRVDDGFTGMLGFNFNSTINFGYSYDLTTSRLNTVSKGSHEIMIGFLLGNRFGDWCPRNLW